MPDRLKVLRIGRGPDILEESVTAPVEWAYAPAGDSTALMAELADANVLVSTVFTQEMAKVAGRLRLIALSAAGYEKIDPEAVPEGCAVTNAYEHERPIAEYVMATVITLDHQILEADRSFRAGDWSMWLLRHGPYREVYGRTMAVVGLGSIGKQVARLCHAFGIRCIASTRTVPSSEEAQELGLDFVGGKDSLHEVLSQADFVLVSTPEIPETRGLIGARELAAMQPHAILVNPARGPIVEEEALYNALKEKRIGAAAIDTWWVYPEASPEPGTPDPRPSRFPFWELDNVIMTPHISGGTYGTRERRARVVADNIDRLAQGKPLVNVVKDISRA